MKFIGKDDVLLEQLMSNIKIISSSIRRFNIFKTDVDGLVIEADFELLYDPGSVLRLRFTEIKEYSFYWNSRFSFYNVETYKLIKKENLFYVSFDPEDETLLDISGNDQDSILFGGFEGYYIDTVA